MVLMPNGRIYGKGEPVSKIAVVRQGLIARQLGDYGEHSDNQIGLAGPGNIATGNLNMFSHRPAIGSYQALVPSSLICCDQTKFLSVVEKDPALFRLLVLQCELSALSDRLAFACMLLQKVDASLKILMLTWAFHFGRLEGDRVIMPRLTRRIIKDVAGCSIGYLDKWIRIWKEQGVEVINGGEFAYPLEVLAEADRYLASMEEKKSLIVRPADIRSYWAKY